MGPEASFGHINRKGQILTFDLMIAIFIFLLIFSAVVIFIYSVADTSNPASVYSAESISNYLNNAATQAADTLVGSPGYPQNWYSSSCPSIQTLGVMKNYYEASPQKLYNLTTLPTNCISQLLRAGDTFNITATYLNYTTVKITEGAAKRNITAGFKIPANATYSVSISRYVTLSPGNVIVRMVFTEWFG